MKKMNKYLYGTEDVPEIPQEVIDERVKLLNKELSKILAQHYSVRDDERKNRILRAIKFWQTINERD